MLVLVRSLTLPMLLLVRSFPYTPDASFREEFLLHSSSWFYWGVSLTLFELVLVRSFSDNPRAGSGEEFLLHSSSWFTEEFLLHSWSLLTARSFPLTPDASFGAVPLWPLVSFLVKRFFLHSSSWLSLVRSFSYTHAMLIRLMLYLFVRIFSSILYAKFIREDFLFHTLF